MGRQPANPFTPPSRQLLRLWRQLGIEPGLIAARGLTVYEEASVLTQVDSMDQPFRLSPEAAQAWTALSQAAVRAGYSIFIVSAFRSYEYQAGLVRGKLNRGDAMDDILKVLAPPGCSEHHTGRAVDLGTVECPGLDESFENTPGFAWLADNASEFGFRLSFPRNNPPGYIYEPWHWCYRAAH